uniref:Dual specificity tyrosine-phosphorylation-regulated kinase mbk-2 n=1 Tax=Strongyloides papillosus TaxID=174720 RepID=A0A0N5C0G1_STREA
MSSASTAASHAKYGLSSSMNGLPNVGVPTMKISGLTTLNAVDVICHKLSKSPSQDSLRSVKTRTSNSSSLDSSGKICVPNPNVPVPIINIDNSCSSGVASSGSSSSGIVEGKRGYRPEDALLSFKDRISPYETTEIFNYNRVYYVGSQAKKRGGYTSNVTNNYGFDDENGGYHLVPHDHVAYRYEILKVIGKGSFGQVVKAFDHKYSQYVALKIVRNERRFHKQADEEIRILEFLRDRDADHSNNIIHMLDNFTFRNHRCITFELLYVNLYELIKQNKFQGFSVSLVRKFAISILQCLKLLSKHGLIHCDLKPENIMLKAAKRSGIKVIDFGSSCFDNQRVYTYIQSRFYRAPEVILGTKYSKPIDMWSFGCILAELFTGHPLLPGEDEADQIALTIELLGMPPPSLLEGAKRTKNFINSKGFPRYCRMVQSPTGTISIRPGTSKRGKPRGVPGSKGLANAIRDPSDTLFVDFLARCLEWDPNLRITPEQCLKHPFITRKLPLETKEY